MKRNKIYAIVEGHGEAISPKKGQPPAVYALIAKLLVDLQCWTLFPPRRHVRVAHVLRTLGECRHLVTFLLKVNLSM